MGKRLDGLFESIFRRPEAKLGFAAKPCLFHKSGPHSLGGERIPNIWGAYSAISPFERDFQTLAGDLDNGCLIAAHMTTSLLEEE